MIFPPVSSVSSAVQFFLSPGSLPFSDDTPLLTNAIEAKAASRGQRKRDIRRRRQSTARGQQQHRNATRAEQLRRHHPVRIAGTAQNPDEAESHRCEHKAGGSKQELRHSPRARSSARSSRASVSAI